MNYPVTPLRVMGVALLLASFGCDNSDEPTCDGSFSLNIVSQTSARCESTGSVEVTTQGQNGSVMYRIGSGSLQNSGTFENLEPGSYQIIAQDEGGCEATLLVTINEEVSDLMISNIATNSSACLESVGSLTVEAQGGNPEYQYRINQGEFQSAAEFSNLTPGDYTVTVQDADGCFAETTVRVASDVSFSNTIQDIISTNCAVTGCHVAGTNIPDFSVTENIIDEAARIKSRTEARTMPPSRSGRTLTDEQITQIACWVDDGAQNN